MRPFLLPAVCLAVLALAAPLAGQDAYATALLPPDHWSVDAVRRLAGLGLVEGGHDLSQRMPSQREVGRILEAAAAHPSHHARLARSYRDRFRDELSPEAAADRGLPVRAGYVRGSAIGVGWTARSGQLATGWGYEPGYVDAEWIQPAELADRSRLGGEATFQYAAGSLALRVRAGGPEGEEALREAYATLGVGAVTGWVGRRRFAWGPSPGPGLVMNGGRYDSFGVQVRPFRMPWLLRHAGPVTFELAVGLEDFEHSFENTGFLATRGSVTPHERLQLGVSRAAFFGGEGNTDVDLFAILSVLIGKHAGEVSELDNQLVAVDVSFRLPTERWLPVRAYVEWGFEDSAGAFRNVPGVIAGIDVPAVPGMPRLALAVERTSFAASCCGNPIWYRHSNFLDGWTQDGEPLGHPLGGHGEEWSLRGRLALLDARLRIDASAFARERGFENLYADVRVGESRGGTLMLEADITSHLRLRAGARLDDGDGWREVRGAIGLQGML